MQSNSFSTIRFLLLVVMVVMCIGTGLLLWDSLLLIATSHEKGAAASLASAALFFSLGVFALAISHGISRLQAIERYTWLALPEETRTRLEAAAPEESQ